MNTILTAISPIWKVLLVGLILGAGLPLLFALGVRGMAGTTDSNGTVHPASGGAKAGAYLCFLVIAAAVVLGLLILTSVKPVLHFLGLS